MYEKEIEILSAMVNGEDTGVSGQTEAKTLLASLALMRAAQPKDDAAEREHCTQCAVTTLTDRLGMGA